MPGNAHRTARSIYSRRKCSQPSRCPQCASGSRTPFFAYRASQRLRRQGESGKPLIRLTWAVSLRGTGKRDIPILPARPQLTQVEDHFSPSCSDRVLSREKGHRSYAAYRRFGLVPRSLTVFWRFSLADLRGGRSGTVGVRFKPSSGRSRMVFWLHGSWLSGSLNQETTDPWCNGACHRIRVA